MTLQYTCPITLLPLRSTLLPLSAFLVLLLILVSLSSTTSPISPAPSLCTSRRIRCGIVAFSFSPVTPIRSAKWCLVSLTLGCEVKDVVQGKPVDSLQGAGSDQR